MIDFEKKFNKTLEINFPEDFSDLIKNKLTRQQKKLTSVKDVIVKIEHRDDTIYKNILSLHLLAYLFKCSTDSNGNKLSKVEIADHLLQVKEVGFNESNMSNFYIIIYLVSFTELHWNSEIRSA